MRQTVANLFNLIWPWVCVLLSCLHKNIGCPALCYTAVWSPLYPYTQNRLATIKQQSICQKLRLWRAVKVSIEVKMYLNTVFQTGSLHLHLEAHRCKLWGTIINHAARHDIRLPTRYSVYSVQCSPLPVHQLRAKLNKMSLKWNQQQTCMQLLSVQNY